MKQETLLFSFKEMSSEINFEIEYSASTYAHGNTS